ncbi:EsaB/YukD family protein [Paenactinomyces guangxiensis]|uniref:EsaB/YukD family protein n=1 Tax=Paenactinomyces guangxiensis TaxID=1490290 RepID=A0A7W1WUT4_9BACL|nr:EsaB/YukD family protein [Paenactinomyces guangxiensis]MBA4496347.1 EsaB/YukD family protein [Paenactinomyces guangxiensis]MBH8593631.1 EsaB/YukD family protein [Paenactinomyces guangxiensis]
MGTIVTIVTGSNKQDWIDFELPSDIPVAQVTLMLVEAVRNEAPDMAKGKYILEVKTQTGDWKKLDETRSLDHCSVMDGAYLRIQKKPEEDPHAAIADQLERMSSGKEKSKELLEAWRTDHLTNKGVKYQ